MRQKRNMFYWIIAAGIILSLNACNTGSQQRDQESQQDTLEPVKEKVLKRAVTPDKAICVLHPTEGNEVSGTVKFTQDGAEVKVVADLEGLTPGKHGFHIHEYGDCSNPDGTSAGGHYNPLDKKHGAPTDANRHVGDLGNIEADENGNAHLEMTDTLINLGGRYSIIGRAVIVHADEDDFESQPTGNAGARVACGVIGIDQ